MFTHKSLDFVALSIVTEIYDTEGNSPDEKRGSPPPYRAVKRATERYMTEYNFPYFPYRLQSW